MFLIKLLLRNAFRTAAHQPDPAWAVAIAAFGLLRTVNEAWYSGVQASSSTRLISRSAISLTFNLPLAYAQRVKAVDGVSSVSWANWFGGVYQTERNSSPNLRSSRSAT